MRILLRVGHPAHVHLLRYPARILASHGHEVRFAAIRKEMTIDLLELLGLDYVIVGTSHKTILWKSLDVVSKDLKLVRLIKDNGFDIVVSAGIPYASQAAKLCGIPSIAFFDTEVSHFVLKTLLPFVSAICTPSCFTADLGTKQIRYDGYHEIAYLHPKYFTPDPSVLEAAGLEKGETFMISRFSSADSSHDIGWSGFSFKNTEDALSFFSALERETRILLTSERPLPARLRKYKLDIPFHRLHDLLSFASLYVGE
ncbi:MAG: hypothetical protein ACE5KV_04405, partial [Thermoplasmata archaeon]